jgi:phosphate starvation-inducible protein PhoH and related proteins
MPTATETLEYETPHFLQSLFANDLNLLKQLGTDLNLVVTTRDGWVKFQGEPENIEAAKRVFTQLESARREGADINAHFFKFALGSAMDGEKSGESLQDLTSVKLLGTARKPPVIPKTRTQLKYLQAMDKNEVVFGLGAAGTGKTYLAMAKALASLKAGLVKRIVLTRPAVEAGEALGFLPGDMNEKIFPYLRPLYDALYDMLEPDEVEKMIEKGVIEIAPLAFMRGRTLSKAFIILDEAQNTTQAQMFMFLTRLGEGSRYVITGDPTQIDLKDRRTSGLREAAEALKNVPGIHFIQFEGGDVVRHPVVMRIIEAYDKHRRDLPAPEPRRNQDFKSAPQS